MTITNPVVNKVFNDLEAFREFCTTSLDRYGNPMPYDEANLYNEKSWVWKAYKKSKYTGRGKPRFNTNRVPRKQS